MQSVAKMKAFTAAAWATGAPSRLARSSEAAPKKMTIRLRPSIGVISGKTDIWKGEFVKIDFHFFSELLLSIFLNRNIRL